MSVHGFDGLRSDTYEKQIAARSLTELAGFYRTLMEASGSYEKKQKLCPVWNRGGKCGDKLPDIKTLCNIKERILMEGRLADMSGHLKAFTAVAESLTGLPVAERAVILQGMQALIAAELMRLTIEGGKVLDHLPAVDRVIRAASAQARGENMEARVKLDVERLRLQEKALQIRADDRRQDMEKKRKAESEKAEAEPPRKQETPNEMIKRIYGKNPFIEDENSDNEPQPVTESKAETKAEPQSHRDTEGEIPKSKPMIGSNQASAVAETSSLHLISADKMADKPEKLQTSNSNADEGNRTDTTDKTDKAKAEAQPVAAVESWEEQQRRERVEADRRAWAARQAKIRDRENGTERWFNPYA